MSFYAGVLAFLVLSYMAAGLMWFIAFLAAGRAHPERVKRARHAPHPSHGPGQAEAQDQQQAQVSTRIRAIPRHRCSGCSELGHLKDLVPHGRTSDGSEILLCGSCSKLFG